MIPQTSSPHPSHYTNLAIPALEYPASIFKISNNNNNNDDNNHNNNNNVPFLPGSEFEGKQKTKKREKDWMTCERRATSPGDVGTQNAF
jgi:hypothetical protein